MQRKQDLRGRCQICEDDGDGYDNRSHLIQATNGKYNLRKTHRTIRKIGFKQRKSRNRFMKRQCPLLSSKRVSHLKIDISIDYGKLPRNHNRQSQPTRKHRETTRKISRQLYIFHQNGRKVARSICTYIKKKETNLCKPPGLLAKYGWQGQGLVVI